MRELPGRPEPDDLNEPEQTIWENLTYRLPAEWFVGATEPLLKQLVRHIHHADLLAGEIRRAEPELGTDAKRWAVFRAMSRAFGYQFRQDRYAQHQASALPFEQVSG